MRGLHPGACRGLPSAQGAWRRLRGGPGVVRRGPAVVREVPPHHAVAGRALRRPPVQEAPQREVPGRGHPAPGGALPGRRGRAPGRRRPRPPLRREGVPVHAGAGGGAGSRRPAQVRVPDAGEALLHRREGVRERRQRTGSGLEAGGEDGGSLLLGAPLRAVREVHGEAGGHLQQPQGESGGIRGRVHPHGQGGGRVPSLVPRHAVAGAPLRRRAVACAGEVLRRAGDPDAGGGRARRQDGDPRRPQPGEPLLRHGVPVHGRADQAAAGGRGRGGQGVPALAAPPGPPPRAQHRVGEVRGRAVHLLRVRGARAWLGVPVHRLRLRDPPQVRPERRRWRQRGDRLAPS